MKTENCPCGSGEHYVACCEPILKDHAQAITAEQLMRSRYTAFYLKDTNHILRSWHKDSRPLTLNFEAHPCRWLGLEIHVKENGEAGDLEGQVEFTATYIEDGYLCSLRERSVFKKENKRWYYVTGNPEVKRTQPHRNQPCICGSGKKFKRCCLQ